MFVMECSKVSLPLLIALLTLIDVTRSFEYFIDLERCKLITATQSEMNCYVRASCLILPPPSADPEKELARVTTKDPLKNDTCDVIMQIKAFSNHRYHIMMQVNISGNEPPLDGLDTDVGFSLMQVSPILQCSSNGVNGSVVFGGKYGTRQIVSDKLIFCSAFLSQKPQISAAFDAEEYDIEPQLEFSYKDGQKETIKYGSSGSALWTFEKTACDDEKLNTENKTYMDSGTKEDYLLFEIDKNPLILSCPDRQHIWIELKKKMFMTSSLSCNLGASKWTYKDGENDTRITKGQPFFAYCAIKFTDICASTPLIFKKCSGCSKPSNVSIDAYTCPENRWRMGDGSVEETEVKCKRVGNERTSAWQTNKGKIITEGACSADFDCATLNNFDFTIPKKDNVHVYKAVDQIGGGNRLNCSEGFNLTYISSDGATKIIEKDLVCNTENGYFYPEGHSKEQDKQTNNTSSVYCAKKHGEVIKKDESENAEPATGAMSSKTIAASIGGAFAFLLIIGGIIAFLLFRRSKRIEEEKALEEKKRNTLSTCREIDIYKEVLRQNGNKWVIDEIPEKERNLRDRIRNRLIDYDPLDYHVIADQKAADNDLFPRKGEFDYWTQREFVNFVFYKFHRYTFDYRIICVRALTSFISFSASDDWKGKSKKGFGTVNQFFDILKMSHVHKVKDFEVWEHLYRLSMRFYASCTDSPTINPKRRFRDLWKEIAKSMLNDLGGKTVRQENYQMTGIRRIALRIMLWLKDKKWTAFIAEEAKKPLRSIAEEIRPVVLQYAVREGGREEEIKREFHDEVKREEWESWEGVRHGIYRHHLIYALCSAKDKPDEEGQLRNTYVTRREIIDVIYKNPKDLNRIFTPKDIYWAFKGATEEPEAAVYCVDMYSTNMCSYSAADYEAWIDVIIRRTEGLENKRERMLDRLQEELIATMILVGESCASDGLFNELKDAWRGCVEFAVPKWASPDVFNEELLAERAHNVRFLCDHEKLNKLIVAGMEQSGFRLAPIDGGAGA